MPHAPAPLLSVAVPNLVNDEALVHYFGLNRLCFESIDEEGFFYSLVGPVRRTRGGGHDEIRRDRNYLDTVDEIWGILRRYVA